jgi:hypothetical protein
MKDRMPCVFSWFWEMVGVLQMVEVGCDDDAKYSAHARIRPRCSSRRVTAGSIKGTVERDHVSQQNFA